MCDGFHGGRALAPGAPPQAAALADQALLQTPYDANLEPIDQARWDADTEAAVRLLYAHNEAMDHFLPRTGCAAIVQEFGIDARIKQRMNVNVGDLEDSGELDDAASEPSMSAASDQQSQSFAHDLVDDFDDSMSMFSANSKMTTNTTGTAASGFSSTSSVSIVRRLNQGQRQRQLAEESVYKNLLTGLLLANPNKDVDLNLLEKSITQKLYNKHRKTNVYDIPQPDAAVTKPESGPEPQ